MDILHEYGVEFPCGGRGTCGNCKVKLLSGKIEATPEHQALLTKKGLDSSWRLACLSTVEEDLSLELPQWENIILADNSTFDFKPKEGLGIAVDLGSTTIVSQLVDLRSGKVLGVQTAVNPQSKYGADIMSRIALAMDGKDNSKKLQTLSQNAVYEQVKVLLSEHNAGALKDICLVGNSVMQHLFCGFDVTPLSAFPFLSNHNEEVLFKAKDLDWSIIPGNVQIRFMPNMGSFVGSDILAGIAATKMHLSEKYSVLVDLGTNGEIAVGNSQRILYASTSAGPAFEGASISNGMRASTGAISSVSITDSGSIASHVIGNTTPRGICGSGLIDAIAVYLKSGQIDETGAISNGDELKVDGISISQKDIREVQLAKAAIATGIELLASKLNITRNDIEHVYIAGGFGSYVNINNAIAIGLLEFSKNKITTLGNTALIGAKMFLFEEKDTYNTILKTSEHYSLETSGNFQDVFCDKLMFNSNQII